MSDRGSRDRQVMTLLVQLFGRDVMDRLAGAGFDAPAAMAKASAERLAAEAGIPIAIARRVAIVVEEAPAPAAATPSKAATQSKPAAAAPQDSAAAARTEPASRSASAAQTEPASRPASAARTEPASQSVSATRTEPARQPDSAARTASSARSKSVERTEVGQAESDMLMDFAAPPEPVTREERRPAKPAARKREPRVSVEPITPRTPAAPPLAAPSPAVAPPDVASPMAPRPAEATSAPAPASSVLAGPSAAAGSSVAAASTATSAVRDSIPEEGDPFVDDVALVSWMGLSSHQPDGRLAFTVSDTILDPVAESASGAEDRDADRPAEPERLMPAAAPIEAPARPSTISGSFWTFGRPADQTPPTTGPKPESQPPASSPRRRKHDGH